MIDLETNVARLHDRLDAIRDEIEGEFQALYAELDEARGEAEQLKSADSDQDKRVKQLEERAEGQSELIATLTQEAEEARALRAEVRDRDLEIEKLESKLSSKDDLVSALRRQVDEGEQLKAAAKQHDKKIFEQQHELDRKQKELDRSASKIAELKDELRTESERAATETVVDNAEIESLKAELDVRKTLIKSLKEDAERADALEAQLEAKRDAISSLEDAIDQHADTIAELRRSIDAWKEKYSAAKGEKFFDGDCTMTELPSLTDTEVDVLKELETSDTDTPAATVAIDMRDALKEARSGKKAAKS